MKLFKGIILTTLFLMNPVALFGDDESDVMEVIKTWASLEGDLNIEERRRVGKVG